MTKTLHKIETNILDILAACTIDGNHVRITSGQLDRQTYQQVNRVLDLMGGKWNRTAKAHVFSESPIDLMDTVLLTGEITDTKKLFQQFFTPRNIVEEMIQRGRPEAGDRILEPSAGSGNIVFRLSEIDTPAAIAVEIDEKHIPSLRGLAGRVHHGDFLQCSPTPRMGGADLSMLGTFDLILMNPPFTRGQDIAHIKHALKFLKPKGRLVSICANGPRQQVALEALGLWSWEALPSGTFAESGTNVNTAMLVIKL